MELVILESPFAGERERNIDYARKCMLDCFNRNEAPFASHLLYTQCLDDDFEPHRFLGITAGLKWGEKATKSVVYTDYGISKGMEYGIKDAEKNNRVIEYRTIL